MHQDHRGMYYFFSTTAAVPEGSFSTLLAVTERPYQELITIRYWQVHVELLYHRTCGMTCTGTSTRTGTRWSARLLNPLPSYTSKY